MLIGDDLPELGTDLVAALASLDVDDFAHVCWERGERGGEKKKRKNTYSIGCVSLVWCGTENKKVRGAFQNTASPSCVLYGGPGNTRPKKPVENGFERA